jgi:hypothetical protein
MSVLSRVLAVAMLAFSGVAAQSEPQKVMVSFGRKLNTAFKEQNDPVR